MDIPVKALSKKEMASILDVSPRTLATWLKPFTQEIGPYRGRRFTPRQVQIIKSKIE
jgi:transposase